MSNRRASRRENIDAFVARTDPLVVQAMKKTSKAPLTIEEQAALDNWLEPRIDALVDRLTEHFLATRDNQAPYGYRQTRRNRKWPPTARSATKASSRSDRSMVTTS